MGQTLFVSLHCPDLHEVGVVIPVERVMAVKGAFNIYSWQQEEMYWSFIQVMFIEVFTLFFNL